MNILILGAGQLARMMSLSATHLDIHVLAYDVGSKTVINPVTFESYPDSLSQAIAKADAITAEFEHIPSDVLSQCQQSGKFYPVSKPLPLVVTEKKKRLC